MKTVSTEAAEVPKTIHEKMCKEYIGILKNNTQPSNRFCELDKRIQEDKKYLELRERMSRSNLEDLSEKA